MKTQKRQAIKDKIFADTLSVRKGIYTAKWTYFYSHGKTAEYYKKRVQEQLEGAEILEFGDHWHAFCGGAKAGSARDSYFWVTFKLA